MLPPTHDVRVPQWGTGRADFRRGVDKPLGFAYVQEIFFLKKNFGRDFEEMGPTNKLTRACARPMGHAQPCEKALGFAYGCAMGFITELLQPSWGKSFETFWKVSKLFRKLFNQMRSSLRYVEMLGTSYTRKMVSIFCDVESYNCGSMHAAASAGIRAAGYSELGE